MKCTVNKTGVNERTIAGDADDNVGIEDVSGLVVAVEDIVGAAARIGI